MGGREGGTFSASSVASFPAMNHGGGGGGGGGGEASFILALVRLHSCKHVRRSSHSRNSGSQ